MDAHGGPPGVMGRMDVHSTHNPALGEGVGQNSQSSSSVLTALPIT